jgi:hypothetical protein
MVMNIKDRLRRLVEEYRKEHGHRPLRILLKGESAKNMADELAKEDERNVKATGFKVLSLDVKTSDEAFLDGEPAHYKHIPVIAELADDEVLVVE